MDEALRLVLAELRKSWRYRWYGLLLAWLGSIGGWIYVLSLPDVYRASATVYVDTESLIRDIVGGIAIDTNAEDRVTYVRERLLSRPKLEQVARASDLDLRAPTPAAFDELVAGLRTKIYLGSGGGSRNKSKFERNLYRVSYKDSSPPMALEVVRTLVNTFQEDALSDSQTEQSEAKVFLDEQIGVYEQRLQLAEKNKADFQRQWLSYLPGESGGYFVRLQRERSAIEEVSTELRIAQQRRATLAQRLGESSGPSDTQSMEGFATPADLRRQISDLEFRLNELMVDYTDKHPDVIATREKLDSLRQRLSILDPTGDFDAPAEGVVYDNLKMALNDAEVEIAGFESRLAQHRTKERDLQATVDTVIEVEAKLAQLNRDYEAVRSQYEQLTERREQLILGGEVSETGEVAFEVMEPARVEPQPVEPDRPVLLFMVLGAALAGGVGVAFLLAQLNPVFDSRETLFHETGLPVLGSVSMAWTPAQTRRRQLMTASLGVCAVLLLAAFGVVFVTQDAMTSVIQELAPWSTT